MDDTLPSWLAISGYLKELGSVSWNPDGRVYMPEFTNWDSLTHFRVRLELSPEDYIKGGIEIKHQTYWGDSVALSPYYHYSNSVGNTITDFSWDIVDEDRVLSRLTIDRIYIRAFTGNLEATLGRQRIAWGTGFVWNPFDLFNPLSVLDFDNEEKPGADGLNMNYYFGTASSFAFVYLPGRNRDNATVALQAKANYANYDLCAMTGWFSGNTIMGLAFAGDIKGAGFRGEGTYTADDTVSNYFTVTIGADYTWHNSVYLLGAYLYNGGGEADPLRYNQVEYTGKSLPYLSRNYSYVSLEYDITPLVRGSFGYLQNWTDKSYELIPAIVYGMKTNLDISASAFISGGDSFSEYGESPRVFYAQVKWYY